ncbi:hypothetical protein [Streptomyces sp. SudanB182_2057]|uniref:hypothetical protein n=1 Tax=Streptomyces sp. SudanB182_2057 TaxID=3035281 RepID=UPI003F55861A
MTSPTAMSTVLKPVERERLMRLARDVSFPPGTRLPPARSVRPNGFGTQAWRAARAGWVT